MLDGNKGLGRLFGEAVREIDLALGKRAFRPERALNVAVADSVLVGVMRRLMSGVQFADGELMGKYEALISDSGFVDATTVRTSDEEYVKLRLNKATQAFAS